MNSQGLTEAQVIAKISQGKSNRTPVQSKTSVARIILRNTLTIFNLVNLILAVMVILVGSYKNLLFILIAIANTLISIINEIRAKKTIDRLRLISEQRPAVIRDGKTLQIDQRDLVEGDLTILSLGDQIIVDCEVEQGTIEVNESFITGEQDNIEKHVGDRLISGSFVVSGTCKARVTAVGDRSHLAKLEHSARTIKTQGSQLFTLMNNIVKYISFALIPIGALLLWARFRVPGTDTATAITSTVAALINMIPEGLILLTSSVLALATIRLSKKQVLVQDLYSVETLARVDTIALDKTGTLTTGKMTIHDFILPDGAVFAQPHKASIPAQKSLLTALRLILSTSTTENATTHALREKLLKTGKFKPTEQIKEIIPFSSDRKYSGVVTNKATYLMGAPEFITGKNPDSPGDYRTLAVVKISEYSIASSVNAPSRPLRGVSSQNHNDHDFDPCESSTSQRSIEDDADTDGKAHFANREHLTNPVNFDNIPSSETSKIAERGKDRRSTSRAGNLIEARTERNVAKINMACSQPRTIGAIGFDTSKCQLLGYVRLEDEIRHDAKDIINYFYANDISIKIISGDNLKTVQTIANQVGVKDLRGVDLSTIKTPNYSKLAKDYSIFTRVTPAQKMHLIKALKKQGSTVAMTGDGVNDILAMKEADVSLAIGEGSDAARRSAKMVLLNSDFSAIPSIIDEGRQSINNLERSTTLFLSKTIYASILAVLFTILPLEYPYAPIEMSLLNFACIGLPGFILALEHNAARIKNQFRDNIIRYSVPIGVTISVAMLALSILAEANDFARPELLTVSFFTTFVIDFALIYQISKPLNPLRSSLILTILAVVVIAFAVPSFRTLLDLGILSSNALLITVVLIAVSLSFFALFRFCIKSLKKPAHKP